MSNMAQIKWEDRHMRIITEFEKHQVTKNPTVYSSYNEYIKSLRGHTS